MIKEFQKEYRWLSNFWPCRIEFEGRTFKSVEHAYQGAKSNEPSWKDYCSRTESPKEVKKESRKITLRTDWLKVRVSIMKQLLVQKFVYNVNYRRMLLETSGEYIQEGNTWGDRFWGVDITVHPTVGKNILGKLIMEVRETIKHGN
jgi:hypothetical protein